MEHPERDAPDLEEQLVEERVRRWMKEDVGKRPKNTMKDGQAGAMETNGNDDWSGHGQHVRRAVAEVNCPHRQCDAPTME